MIRVYIMIIVVGLVGGVVYGGYAYYQDTQQRLKTLQQNNAKLEVAVKSKDEALNFMTSNFEKQSELNKELSGKLADAEKENTVIRDKLAKSNLIQDSIANPQVMEQKINEQIPKKEDCKRKIKYFPNNENINFNQDGEISMLE